MSTAPALFAWLFAPWLAAAPAQAVDGSSARAPVHLVHVEAADARAAARLLALDLDLVEGLSAEGDFQVVAGDLDLARISAAGFAPRVVQRDLEAFYAARLSVPPVAAPDGSLGQWLTPPFGQGSMGGYYPLNQLTLVLDQMVAAYPNLLSPRTTFGTTTEGRPMFWMRLSDNPTIDENEPEARIDALHHAREPQGMQTTLWFMLWLLENYPSDPLAKFLVENRELYFVPCVNPDGYAYNQQTNPSGGGLWRKNRRNNGGGSFGVDLNRNYNWKWGFDNTGSSSDPNSETYRGPSPASEPEIQAMQVFFGSRQFQTTLSVHTFSNFWMSPYGYDTVLPANNALYNELSALMTADSGYVFGPIWQVLYTANGSTVDYDHDVRGSLAWTPEIGNDNDGFWPAQNRIVPLAEENLLGFQRIALTAGAWVHAQSVVHSELGNGDGFFAAGEKVRVVAQLKNLGRFATATPVALQLQCSSPFVNLSAPSANLGALASQATASNAATPLEFEILPGTPGGTSIAFQTLVVAEGYAQSFSSTIVVGQPRLVLVDDAEIDWGWTKGVAGDNATSGLWTRGSPIGTNSGGQAANPGTDFSAAPGVQCYMTGNGGGAAGNDDVDNGVTTLLSPVFDLSQVGAPMLSYARWFADLSVADDVLEIALSNDGGSSWVPLESVAQNQNSWQEVSFDVSAVLPLSSHMRLRVRASDQPNNSLVEAALDELRVRTFASQPRLLVYGTPAVGGTVLLNVTGPAGGFYSVHSTLVDPQSAGSGTPKIGVPLSRVITTGTIGPDGSARKTIALPSDPAFHGRTLWLRAGVSGADGGFTNWDDVELP